MGSKLSKKKSSKNSTPPPPPPPPPRVQFKEFHPNHHQEEFSKRRRPVYESDSESDDDEFEFDKKFNCQPINLVGFDSGFNNFSPYWDFYAGWNTWDSFNGLGGYGYGWNAPGFNNFGCTPVCNTWQSQVVWPSQTFF
ncbi:unnamed protein product [Brachionus calyciflorus]|uniref:Uncharacterized protein n=1 Tax=Brachionus calyciflorus TaxID=104777 RepID=A0A814EXQ2_9BILA|nr:unnamed protein product [Brachionus calyciflorus]